MVLPPGRRRSTPRSSRDRPPAPGPTASDSTTKVEGPIFDQTTTNKSVTNTDTSFVVLDGPGFEDLSVDERHAVLDKSGADAVLSVRVVIGGQMGVWEPNQNVEVMVKLGVNRGDAMAWAARCTASSNVFATVDAALENAARCAIYGATGR